LAGTTKRLMQQGSLVAMSDGIRLAFQLPPTATFSITMQDGKDLI
jgi:hypothetical protein